MTKIFRLALLIGIFILGCDEDKVRKAPPETMIVKLNGAALTPDATFARTASAGIIGDGLSISGVFLSDTSVIHNHVNIWLTKAGVGRVQLKGNVMFLDPPGSISLSTPSKTLFNSWTVNEAIVGSVTITKLDFKKNLVSGMFQVKLKSVDGAEIVELTEGSFTDLWLQP